MKIVKLHDFRKEQLQIQSLILSRNIFQLSKMNFNKSFIAGCRYKEMGLAKINNETSATDGHLYNVQ